MSHPTHLLRSFTPWRIAAVAIMAMTLSMSLWGHAEAAIGVTVTLNDNVAGNQTNLTVDITDARSPDGPRRHTRETR